MKPPTKKHPYYLTFIFLSVVSFCLFAPSARARFSVSSAPSTIANAGPDITVYAGEALRLDGSASIGYIRESLPDGTASIKWRTGDGYDVENMVKAPHVYLQPGTYTAELTIKDASGLAFSDAATVNVLPINSTAANVQTLTDSGDPETNRFALQAALDRGAANPNSNEIVVPAGFIANDPIVLPARSKSFGTYVTVRVADLSGLPPLRRVTSADRSKLFTINARPAAVSGYNQAILIQTSSNYYRFVGMAIDRTGGANTYKNDIIAVAVDSTEVRPSHLIFDRILIDAKGNNTVRAFAPNSEVTSLLNSSILNVRTVGAETKAIGQWSGNGPLAVVNNRLEAAAINFLVGGAYVNYDSEVLDGLVFRGNHSWKDPLWIGPNGESLGYTIKNLWELKCGHNIVAAGNIFENNYADGQAGEAILIKSASQPEQANPRAEVSNVDFRNNKILNTRAGFNVVGLQSWIAPHPRYANHIRFTNNFWQEREGRGNLILTPDYFELNHNTFISMGSMNQTMALEPSLPGDDPTGVYKAPGLKILNNLSHPSLYGTLLSPAGQGTRALNYAFSDWDARANVFTGSFSTDYPAGNYFPSSYESVFTNYAEGDYSLQSNSIYRNAATDGRDIGADIAILNSQTSSARDGLWTVVPGGTPQPTTATVSGQVTNAGSGQIARVRVTLTNSSGATLQTSPNRSGYYRFINVPAGTYSIGVTGKGGYLVYSSVWIGPGTDNVFNIALRN